jgi:hypothetical protein
MEDNIKADLKEVGCGVWGVRLASAGSGSRQEVADSCEHKNDPSVSVDAGEFLDQLNDCQLIKKGSISWH